MPCMMNMRSRWWLAYLVAVCLFEWWVLGCGCDTYASVDARTCGAAGQLCCDVDGGHTCVDGLTCAGELAPVCR